MPMLKHIHRDMLNRVIKIGDHIAWANSDYGSKIRIGIVTHTTPKKVYFILPTEDNRESRAYPINMLVITQQVLENIKGNVGGSKDLEDTRKGE